jgi:hypothetical protein
MSNYTKNDELFSKLSESKANEGITIVSKLNQNNKNTFKLVDVVDIDWDGAKLYIENESGNTIENIISDSSEFLTILQDTINKSTGDKTIDLNVNCSILENSKLSMYLINNEYMKVDYYGSTVYDDDVKNYIYSDSFLTQHMYIDKDLTTFIPGLPYQNPFKAIVALNMPLAFNQENLSHQKLVMCKDFILGDEQNDHGVMCPKWYNESRSVSWDGENTKGLIVKYTNNNTYPIVSHTDTIDISFGENLTTVVNGDGTYSVNNVSDTTAEVFTEVKAINNVASLIDRDFILVYKDKMVAAWEIASTGKYYQQIGISLSGDSAIVGENVIRFNIELADNYSPENPKVYLKEKKSGKYVNYIEKDLNLSLTAGDYWLLYFDADNNALFKTYATNYTLGFNVSSPRFKPYTLDGNNLDYIQLYVSESTVSEKVSPELYWENQVSYKELYLNSNFTNKCLSRKTSDLTVTYKSSNSNVATVDSTGKLKLIGLGSTIISATSEETDTYLSETIKYQINVIQNIPTSNETKYIMAFIYPLIKVTDTEGKSYSPLLISFKDNSKQIIKDKYLWMNSEDSLNILNRNINNQNYKQNHINFFNEHITQLNKTFIGDNGVGLPSTEDKLGSLRVKTWKDTETDNSYGQIQYLDSLLKMFLSNKVTIELNTIDEDGYLISCGSADNYSKLQSIFNDYSNYAQGKINQVFIDKYPWLF